MEKFVLRSNIASKGKNFHFQIAKEEDERKQYRLGQKAKILSNLSKNYTDFY